MEDMNMLLRIYQKIPPSSSSMEKKIQCREKIDVSWIGARSGANHLNNIVFANLHKVDVYETDVTEVARDFSQANNKRGHFFGTF